MNFNQQGNRMKAYINRNMIFTPRKTFVVFPAKPVPPLNGALILS
jgi:hypothetical protein